LEWKIWVVKTSKGEGRSREEIQSNAVGAGSKQGLLVAEPGKEAV
jgi:hypothetical protein